MRNKNRARKDEDGEKPSGGAFIATMLVSLSLVLLIALLYFRVGGYEFIELDDNQYVANNAQVRQGVTWEGLSWALSSLSRSNWHPVTWLSHMLDVDLFGMDAGRHHLVNVLLHAFSAVLLFLVLRAMTTATWRSGFVAALFAVHPLHVESVAWIAERKDVLSGLFFMLTLLAYARYVRRPAVSSYLVLAALFLLGLMSKPMLVTMPFLLLLLDIWPLQRTAVSGGSLNSGVRALSWRRLAAEKIPLLVLSIASAVITLIAQQKAMGLFDVLPLSTRAANAAISYVRYLVKMVWPANLAIPYPYAADREPWWVIAAAVVILVSVSLLVVRQIKSRPYLATGWLWYLIMLAPVSGLIQVGRQAMADRYTYLPLIGPFIAITWFMAETGHERTLVRKGVLPLMAIGVLAAFFAVSFVQLSYWQNGVSLFSHTLAVTSGNADAHKFFAIALSRRGQYEDAIRHFSSALNLRPDDAETQRNMGLTLVAMGRRTDAVAHFREAVRIAPDDKLARSFLQVYGQEKQQGEEKPNAE